MKELLLDFILLSESSRFLFIICEKLEMWLKCPIILYMFDIVHCIISLLIIRWIWTCGIIIFIFYMWIVCAKMDFLVLWFFARLFAGSTKFVHLAFPSWGNQWCVWCVVNFSLWQPCVYFFNTADQFVFLCLRDKKCRIRRGRRKRRETNGHQKP